MGGGCTAEFGLLTEEAIHGCALRGGESSLIIIHAVDGGGCGLERVRDLR